MFREHLDYLLGLAKAGKDIMAGPWRNEPGGLTLVRVASDAEAEAIIQNDPIVKLGVLAGEAKVWMVIIEDSPTATVTTGR